ncbi:HAD domain-containing protein [Streptomyces sp. NPDC050418]|uniref:HAD domain-containing protein n=1 Tax=Streptomyces sp. NPDC050418 TaxID=3365612 RepID=UPI0037A0C31E
MLPLLFLDVDGPLIPFGGMDHPTYAPSPGNPLLGRVNPAVGPQLLALHCDVVWATTWGEDANTEVAPRLGLPRLPVLAWQDEGDLAGVLHWKTRPIVAWAQGRPFVWIDDEIRDRDRTWVSAAHPGPALLHRVDPRLGLTEADFATVARWLREVTSAP